MEKEGVKGEIRMQDKEKSKRQKSWEQLEKSQKQRRAKGEKNRNGKKKNLT